MWHCVPCMFRSDHLIIMWLCEVIFSDLVLHTVWGRMCRLSRYLCHLAIKVNRWFRGMKLLVCLSHSSCYTATYIKLVRNSLTYWVQIKMSSILLITHFLERNYYTPLQRSWNGGYYTGFTLSVPPSVDRIVSALYLQQYSSDPFHIYTPYLATSEGVSRVTFVSRFKNLQFWQILLICKFDFVFFWLGIHYVYSFDNHEAAGVSSERRHSSCSSLDLDSNFPKCFVPVQIALNVPADVQMMALSWTNYKPTNEKPILESMQTLLNDQCFNELIGQLFENQCFKYISYIHRHGHCWFNISRDKWFSIHDCNKPKEK